MYYSRKIATVKNGDVFSTASGPVEVIDYKNSRSILIRFKKTGYEKVTGLSALRAGEIKDRLLPFVKGVGYLGIGKYNSSVNDEMTPAYRKWIAMITRAYCQKKQARHPTYIGTTVHADWHNFQVFAAWFDRNYIEGYELDKDKLSENGVRGNLYSADTCCFLSPQENSQISLSKPFRFAGPDGVIHEGVNKRKFMRENGLNSGSVSRLERGLINSHKGWTKAPKTHN